MSEVNNIYKSFKQLFGHKRPTSLSVENTLLDNYWEGDLVGGDSVEIHTSTCEEQPVFLLCTTQHVKSSCGKYQYLTHICEETGKDTSYVLSTDKYVTFSETVSLRAKGLLYSKEIQESLEAYREDLER